MNKSKKLLITLAILSLLTITAYLIVSYVVFDMMTAAHPNCSSVYMDGRRDFTPVNFKGVYDYPEINLDVTPYLRDEYEDVEFPAREDEVGISAWFVPASTPSDAVVIVVHGADVCKRNTSVLLPAGMLSNNGFNVLLIDLRNHGTSEVVGKRFSAGVHEYKDVLGAYDWLLAQGYASDKIGVMGVSMGAAASLNAFGAETDVAAIWADSSFSDISSLLDDQLAMNGLPIFIKSGVLFMAKLNGFDLTAVDPRKSIQNNAQRPIMLVHGTEDEWVNVMASTRLNKLAGLQSQLWTIEGTRHVEAMFIYPEEYSQRMTTFFKDALDQ